MTRIEGPFSLKVTKYNVISYQPGNKALPQWNFNIAGYDHYYA